MKESQRKRKPVEYNIRFVPEYGEVGAGRVVPFVPRSGLVPVALPSNVEEGDVGSVTVSGCSLEDEGVYDGDLLLFTKKFTKRRAMFDAICVIFIIATGELVAKKLLFGTDGTVTLRASGGGVKDIHYHGDDIEIKGIAIGFQRMFGKERV